MDEAKTTYQIPMNVTARFEFIEGFGWKELLVCVIAAGGSFLVVSTIGFLLSMVIKLCIVVGITAASFFAVQKNPMTGYSVLQLFSYMRDFNKKQKLYLYKYEL